MHQLACSAWPSPDSPPNPTTSCTPPFCCTLPSLKICGQYFPPYPETAHLPHGRSQQAVPAEGDLHAGLHAGGPIFPAPGPGGGQRVPKSGVGVFDLGSKITRGEASYNIL